MVANRRPPHAFPGGSRNDLGYRMLFKRTISAKPNITYQKMSLPNFNKLARVTNPKIKRLTPTGNMSNAFSTLTSLTLTKIELIYQKF